MSGWVVVHDCLGLHRANSYGSGGGGGSASGALGSATPRRPGHAASCGPSPSPSRSKTDSSVSPRRSQSVGAGSPRGAAGPSGWGLRSGSPSKVGRSKTLSGVELQEQMDQLGRTVQVRLNRSLQLEKQLKQQLMQTEDARARTASEVLHLRRLLADAQRHGALEAARCEDARGAVERARQHAAQQSSKVQETLELLTASQQQAAVQAERLDKARALLSDTQREAARQAARADQAALLLSKSEAKVAQLAARVRELEGKVAIANAARDWEADAEDEESIGVTAAQLKAFEGRLAAEAAKALDVEHQLSAALHALSLENAAAEREREENRRLLVEAEQRCAAEAERAAKAEQQAVVIDISHRARMAECRTVVCRAKEHVDWAYAQMCTLSARPTVDADGEHTESDRPEEPYWAKMAAVEAEMGRRMQQLHDLVAALDGGGDGGALSDADMDISLWRDAQRDFTGETHAHAHAGRTARGISISVSSELGPGTGDLSRLELEELLEQAWDEVREARMHVDGAEQRVVEHADAARKQIAEVEHALSVERAKLDKLLCLAPVLAALLRNVPAGTPLEINSDLVEKLSALAAARLDGREHVPEFSHKILRQDEQRAMATARRGAAGELVVDVSGDSGGGSARSEDVSVEPNWHTPTPRDSLACSSCEGADERAQSRCGEYESAVLLGMLYRDEHHHQSGPPQTSTPTPIPTQTHSMTLVCADGQYEGADHGAALAAAAAAAAVAGAGTKPGPESGAGWAWADGLTSESTGSRALVRMASTPRLGVIGDRGSPVASEVDSISTHRSPPQEMLEIVTHGPCLSAAAQHVDLEPLDTDREPSAAGAHSQLESGEQRPALTVGREAASAGELGEGDAEMAAVIGSPWTGAGPRQREAALHRRIQRLEVQLARERQRVEEHEEALRRSEEQRRREQAVIEELRATARRERHAWGDGESGSDGMGQQPGQVLLGVAGASQVSVHALKLDLANTSRRLRDAEDEIVRMQQLHKSDRRAVDAIIAQVEKRLPRPSADGRPPVLEGWSWHTGTAGPSADSTSGATGSLSRTTSPIKQRSGGGPGSLAEAITAALSPSRVAPALRQRWAGNPAVDGDTTAVTSGTGDDASGGAAVEVSSEGGAAVSGLALHGAGRILDLVQESVQFEVERRKRAEAVAAAAEARAAEAARKTEELSGALREKRGAAEELERHVVQADAARREEQAALEQELEQVQARAAVLERQLADTHERKVRSSEELVQQMTQLQIARAAVEEQLEARIADLSARIGDLERCVAELEHDKADLRQLMQTQARDADEARRSAAADHDRRIRELAAQAEHLRGALERAQAQSEAAVGDLEALLGKADAGRRAAEELVRVQAGQLADVRQELERRVKLLEEQKRKAVEDLEWQLADQADRHAVTVDELRAQVADVSGAATKYAERVAVAEEARSAAEARADKELREVQHSRALVEVELHGRVRELAVRCEELQGRCATCEAERERERHELQGRARALEVAKTEAEEMLSAQLTGERQQVHALEGQLAHAQQQWAHEAEELRRQAAAAEAERARVQEMSEQQVAGLLVIIESQRTDLDAKLQRERSAALARLDHFERQLSEHAAKAVEAEKQVEDAIGALTREATARQRDKAEAQRALADAEERLDVHKAAAAEVKAELEHVVDALETERETVRRALELEQAQVALLRSQLSTAEAVVDELRDQQDSVLGHADAADDARCAAEARASEAERHAAWVLEQTDALRHQVERLTERVAAEEQTVAELRRRAAAAEETAAEWEQRAERAVKAELQKRQRAEEDLVLTMDVVLTMAEDKKKLLASVDEERERVARTLADAEQARWAAGHHERAVVEAQERCETLQAALSKLQADWERANGVARDMELAARVADAARNEALAMRDEALTRCRAAEDAVRAAEHVARAEAAQREAAEEAARRARDGCDDAQKHVERGNAECKAMAAEVARLEGEVAALQEHSALVELQVGEARQAVATEVQHAAAAHSAMVKARGEQERAVQAMQSALRMAKGCSEGLRREQAALKQWLAAQLELWARDTHDRAEWALVTARRMEDKSARNSQRAARECARAQRAAATGQRIQAALVVMQSRVRQVQAQRVELRAHTRSSIDLQFAGMNSMALQLVSAAHRLTVDRNTALSDAAALSKVRAALEAELEAERAAAAKLADELRVTVTEQKTRAEAAERGVLEERAARASTEARLAEQRSKSERMERYLRLLFKDFVERFEQGIEKEDTATSR